MTDTIAIGDLVELNSGGPLMEVVEMGVRADDGEPTAVCVWSADDGELQRAAYPTTCLKLQAKRDAPQYPVGFSFPIQLEDGRWVHPTNTSRN